MRRLAPLALALALVTGCGSGGDAPEQARTVTVEIGEARQSGDRGGDARPAPARGEPPDVPGVDSCENAREPISEDNVRQAEIAVRCLTNAVRREHGLSELRFDERLARAAGTRSERMAEANFFGHHGPGDSSVRTAVRGTGWIPERESWLLGENIGWAEAGAATPARIVGSWLDSPSHRANILSEHFTEIGVGAVAAVPRRGAEPGGTYTQIFGATGAAARAAQTR